MKKYTLFLVMLTISISYTPLISCSQQVSPPHTDDDFQQPPPPPTWSLDRFIQMARALPERIDPVDYISYVPPGGFLADQYDSFPILHAVANQCNIQSFFPLRISASNWVRGETVSIDESKMGFNYIEKKIVHEGDRFYFCGDLHGSIHTLIHLLQRLEERGECDADWNLASHINIIFLGDYGDYGWYGFETWACLFCLKAKNPSQVTLLRGNHESLSPTTPGVMYPALLRRLVPDVWTLYREIERFDAQKQTDAQTFLDAISFQCSMLPVGVVLVNEPTVGDRTIVLASHGAPSENTDITKLIDSEARYKKISPEEAHEWMWTRIDRKPGLPGITFIGKAKTFSIKSLMSLVLHEHRIAFLVCGHDDAYDAIKLSPRPSIPSGAPTTSSARSFPDRLLFSSILHYPLAILSSAVEPGHKLVNHEYLCWWDVGAKALECRSFPCIERRDEDGF